MFSEFGIDLWFYSPIVRLEGELERIERGI